MPDTRTLDEWADDFGAALARRRRERTPMTTTDPEPTPDPGVRPTYNLFHDGEPVAGAQGVDEFALLRYFHRTHAYSLDHGLKHEGYEARLATPGDPDWFLTDEARADRRALRAAQHLASETMSSLSNCDLTADPADAARAEVATAPSRGRCPRKAVGIRWEHGFADRVCEVHANSAKERGALVIYPRRHDGSPT